MKTARTQKMMAGSPVVLLVNPNKPQSAIIRDLYV